MADTKKYLDQDGLSTFWEKVKTKVATDAAAAQAAAEAKAAAVATDLATNYYNKSEVDTKDSTTLSSAKTYTDGKITDVESKITALGSVMNYKGTKATKADLPTTGNNTGDVWHVTENAGEYAWDGKEWQELGSNIDLSGYVTSSALTTKLADYEKNGNKVTSMSATSTDTQYPSAKAVYTALSGKANSTHSHAISDVTNLQTTLDGKAAKSHTHKVADITDFAAITTEYINALS